MVSSIGGTIFRTSVIGEMNQHIRPRSTQSNRPNLEQVLYIERNLIYLDNLTKSRVTTIDHDDLHSEVKIPMRKVVVEGAKHIHLEKEKEKMTMNTLIERDALL